MTVFIDTSAFIAYLNRDDRYHETAVSIMQTLVQQQEPLLTINYTILETSALIQRRLGLPALQDFQTIMVPLLDIIWVNATLHAEGITAVLAANRRHLSLVDCISFIECRRHGVNKVFTFDQHFAEQGFTLLS